MNHHLGGENPRRKYRYSRENLQKAVEQCYLGRMKVPEASRTFDIPLTTIKDHVRLKKAGLPIKHVGRPKALSSEVENLIVHIMTSMNELGFSLGRYHIKIIIKSILDIQGVKHSRFKNNVPGKDWLVSFSKRHSISFCRHKDILSDFATFTKSVSRKYIQ